MASDLSMRHRLVNGLLIFTLVLFTLIMTAGPRNVYAFFLRFFTQEIAWNTTRLLLIPALIISGIGIWRGRSVEEKIVCVVAFVVLVRNGYISFS